MCVVCCFVLSNYYIPFLRTWGGHRTLFDSFLTYLFRSLTYLFRSIIDFLATESESNLFTIEESPHGTTYPHKSVGKYKSTHALFHLNRLEPCGESVGKYTSTNAWFQRNLCVNPNRLFCLECFLLYTKIQRSMTFIFLFFFEYLFFIFFEYLFFIFLDIYFWNIYFYFFWIFIFYFFLSVYFIFVGYFYLVVEEVRRWGLYLIGIRAHVEAGGFVGSMRVQWGVGSGYCEYLQSYRDCGEAVGGGRWLQKGEGTLR